jgi:hypothetical protein
MYAMRTFIMTSIKELLPETIIFLIGTAYLTITKQSQKNIIVREIVNHIHERYDVFEKNSIAIQNNELILLANLFDSTLSNLSSGDNLSYFVNIVLMDAETKNMSPKNISSLLFTLSMLGDRIRLDHCFMEPFMSFTTASLREFEPHDLAITLRAVAKMGVKTPKTFDDVSMGLVVMNLEKFQSSDLASVVYSLELRDTARVDKHVATRILEECMTRLKAGCFDDDESRNLIYSLTMSFSR